LRLYWPKRKVDFLGHLHVIPGALIRAIRMNHFCHVSYQRLSQDLSLVANTFTNGVIIGIINPPPSLWTALNTISLSISQAKLDKMEPIKNKLKAP